MAVQDTTATVLDASPVVPANRPQTGAERPVAIQEVTPEPAVAVLNATSVIPTDRALVCPISAVAGMGTTLPSMVPSPCTAVPAAVRPTAVQVRAFVLPKVRATVRRRPPFILLTPSIVLRPFREIHRCRRNRLIEPLLSCRVGIRPGNKKQCRPRFE